MWITRLGGDHMGHQAELNGSTSTLELAAGDMPLQDQPLLIPVPRVAKLLGISRSAAYRCAASGDLPTAHLGGRVYVVTAKLRELLESA